MALPRARYFLTYHLTFRPWRFAVSHTIRLFTVSKALGTVRGNAGLFGTFDLAVGLSATDVTEGAGRSGAGGVAGGWFADRQAESRTLRVVALPGTLGEAILGSCKR